LKILAVKGIEHNQISCIELQWTITLPSKVEFLYNVYTETTAIFAHGIDNPTFKQVK
jgi:hypothetical protein